MDIYKQRSRWKIILAVVGIVIIAITLFYSNYLAQRLKENEEKNIYIYTEALKELVNTAQDEVFLDRDISLTDTIVRAFPLPIIFEDEEGILQGENWGENKNTDLAFLAKKKMEFLADGKEAIEGMG